MRTGERHQPATTGPTAVVYDLGASTATRARSAERARPDEVGIPVSAGTLDDHAARLAASERHLVELWERLVSVDPALAGRVAHAVKSIRRAITALESRSIA